jgi:hypothetical protein
VPEIQTRVTPQEMGLREKQKQERLAIGATIAEEAKKSDAPREYTDPFIFRFRKIKNGSFAGLWELSAMKATGKVDEIVIDADSLPNILDAVGNIFANRGF